MRTFCTVALMLACGTSAHAQNYDKRIREAAAKQAYVITTVDRAVICYDAHATVIVSDPDAEQTYGRVLATQAMVIGRCEQLNSGQPLPIYNKVYARGSRVELSQVGYHGQVSWYILSDSVKEYRGPVSLRGEVIRPALDK